MQLNALQGKKAVARIGKTRAKKKYVLYKKKKDFLQKQNFFRTRVFLFLGYFSNSIKIVKFCHCFFLLSANIFFNDANWKHLFLKNFKQ
jgi:hypothetical protein